MFRTTAGRACLWLSSLALICLSTIASVAANEQQIRRDMLQLIDDDADLRRAAVEALVDTKDARLLEFLQSYQRGGLYLHNGKLVLCEKPVLDQEGNKVAPLSDPLTRQPLMVGGKQAVVALRDLKEVSPSRRERKLVNNAVSLLEFSSPDPEKRLAAVRHSRRLEFLPHLQEILKSESVEKIRCTARESILLIRINGLIPDQSVQDRLSAARELGEMRSARALPVLEALLKKIDAAALEGKPIDVVARDTYAKAVKQIESYQRYVRGFEYLFSGLSLGTILILMALGLAIIFGQMGVINMAHGELMMIGAYATYVMQELFVAYFPENAFNWYYVIALPVAFLVAAFVGYIIEITVVRHLYGRPLETLLATWGVSLILIQTVRVIYGDNIAVNNPTWLRGGAELSQDFIVPYNRCFIIVLCTFCVLLIYYLMNHTKLGLLVRATMQIREMADSLGVNTRHIDGYTFAFGAGLAGIAGYALTLIGGITPDMGQNYIVDSFLVVVTGGVGDFAGVVLAGLGLGILNKLLEPTFAAIWGRVLILIAVIIFIQWRPTGLFPPKGRLADV